MTGSLWCRCAALTRLGEANGLLYHQLLFDGQGAKEPGVTIHIPDSMGKELRIKFPNHMIDNKNDPSPPSMKHAPRNNGFPGD